MPVYNEHAEIYARGACVTLYIHISLNHNSVRTK